MEKQVKKLQQGFWILAVYAIFVTLGLMYTFFQTQDTKLVRQGDLLTTKGIVIEDQKGNERILIGAPIPKAENRIRTDTTKVRDLWAKKFPKNFMDLYQNYNHSTNGILFLDENGHDRIAIGDPVPDPYFEKRIGPASGLIINDEKGQERTGYAILNVDGENRVTLGLDNARGTEGIILTLNDDGTSGLAIRNMEQAIFLGKADTSNWFTFDQYPFNGLVVKDAKGVQYNMNSLNKN